jgi:hypothetical protein
LLLGWFLSAGAAIVHALAQLLQLLGGGAEGIRAIAPDVRDNLIVDVSYYAVQFIFDTCYSVPGILFPGVGSIVCHGDTSPHSSMGRRKSSGQ